MGPIERIGRFEIVRKLATGGMGTVWLAFLTGEAGFRRLVALKRAHATVLEDPESVNMFFDEARLAARIHHPNVVPILEIAREGNEPFLVMEYVEGASYEHLYPKRSKRPLPLEIGIRVVLDALAGLHAAHILEDDAGCPLDLVHRDASPQNILVGIDGRSRLTDFGIARAATRVAQATRSGQFKGKLTYSAPEQLRALTMDRRVDVYAMGVVLWETLTGQRLFEAESEAQLWTLLLEKPLRPPQVVRPGLPPELCAVCMRALEREPARRFSTALEFADALEAAARGFVATHRQVGAFVGEVVGAQLHERREAVRTWTASRDKIAALPPEAESDAARPVMTPPQPGLAAPSPAQMASTVRLEGTPSRPSAVVAATKVSGSDAPPALLQSHPMIDARQSSGTGPLPYPWSLTGTSQSVPMRSRAPFWAVAGVLLGVAVVACMVLVPGVMRSRAASAKTQTGPAVASPDALPPPAVDLSGALGDAGRSVAPPPTGTSADAPPDTAGGPASAKAPRRGPVVGPTPPPSHGPGNPKNSEFGDRW